MFGEYVRERDGFEFLQIGDKGFAIYKIVGEECYIRDIYVKPAHRKEKVASQLADVICEAARAKGCKYLTGSVNFFVGDPTTSVKVLLGYGMRILKYQNDLLYFIKDL